MRKWIDILLEADGPQTRTKTKQKTAPSADDLRMGFADPTSKGELATSKVGTQDIDPSKVSTMSKRQASQQLSKMASDPKYRSVASKAMQNMPAGMMDMEPEQDTTDVGADPEPPQPENLPANISKEVSHPDFNPEWMKVKQLPGYMVTQLKTISKQIFQGILPIENFGEMNFISTLTHPEDEVKVVAKWVKEHAYKDDDAFFDVEVIPGYQVRAQLYRTNNYNFFIAKDWMGDEEAGHYVYMWEQGRGTEVGGSTGKEKRIR
jgi:hypothetical protein